jgi:hypothetical protein
MGKKYWTSFKNTTNNHLGGCVVPINGIPFLHDMVLFVDFML